MTAGTRKALDWIAIAGLALLLGAGSGWVSSQREMADLKRTVQRIDERVSAMYCAQVAEHQRAACR